MRAWGALALVVLLVAPLASASWRAAGTLEPDTASDAADGMMWLAPDTTSSAPLVYFAAFQAIEATSVNPNVAATGSRVLTPGAVHHRALLGAWRDCNRDGYVGSAETALYDYPSALLLDVSVCRPDTLHHREGWVSEMIMAGAVDPCERLGCGTAPAFVENERVLYADGTMVWADLGAPGAAPADACAPAPLPAGATRSAGGLLRHADCQAGHVLLPAVAAADTTGALGALLDAPLPVTPFGGPAGPGVLEAGTGRPAARAYDCAADPALVARDPQGPRRVEVEDPTGLLASDKFPAVIAFGTLGLDGGFEDHDGNDATPGVLTVLATDDEGAYARVPGGAPSVDAGGSLWDAASGASCDEAAREQLGAAHPKPYVESEVAPPREGKDRASLVMRFYDGHRGVHDRIDPYTGSETPSDGGLFALRHDHPAAGPMWSATAGSLNEPQLVSRETLEPAGVVVWTYYARLGVDAFAAGWLAPGSRVYGAEACKGDTTGVHGGWACAPTAWWRGVDGEDATPRYQDGTSYAPVPGVFYHARDVDCHDGRLVAGVPADASLVLLTQTACELS